MVKGLKDINREYNQEYLKIDIWNKIEKTTVEAETKLINDYKTATDPKQISSLQKRVEEFVIDHQLDIINPEKKAYVRNLRLYNKT